MAYSASDESSVLPNELAARLHRLEEAYQDCQRLSLSNDYAAAVMHEVTNPLEAITNLVYLAKHESSPEDIQFYLKLVQEQLLVLASIARSSLAFYKGQDEARQVNLAEIAESALKLHFQRLRRGGVSVRTEYCKDASLQGIGSELLQVLSNLMLNAIDALEHTENASIRLVVRRTKSSIQVALLDNGPGVPQQLEQTLLQAHATGKKTGTGMGLWLCRRIASKHGGKLHYRTSRSVGRSGTLFCMTLPVEACRTS